MDRRRDNRDYDRSSRQDRPSEYNRHDRSADYSRRDRPPQYSRDDRSYDHSRSDRSSENSRSGSSDSSQRSNYSYNSSRSNGESGYRGRGRDDRGYRGGGGRGGYGRGGGGPGTGRAGGDDSVTTKLTSPQPELYTIQEIANVPALPPTALATVRANGYEIDSSHAKVAYQYDIQWSGVNKKRDDDKEGKKFNMNWQSKDDVKLQLKQEALFSIFKKLLREYKEFFKPEEKNTNYAYDSGSMFFSQLKLLNVDEKRGFEIDPEKMFDDKERSYYPSMVKATAEVTLTREVNCNALNGDLENDRPAIQYLELVFSQAQRASGDYLCFPGKFYEKKSADPIDGYPMILKDGVVRSIAILGDPAEKRLMVHMLPTKGTFYHSCKLFNMIDDLLRGRISDIFRGGNLKIASEAVKNLVVCTNHMGAKNKNFVVCRLSTEACDRIMFDFKGKSISVAEYFYTRYRINVDGRLPCVIEKKGADRYHYPMECLEIPQNQRVPKAKQSNDLNSKVIRKCQSLPADQVEKIEKERDNAEIMNSNDYIRATGVRVEPRRLVTAPAQQLVPPAIVFKDTQKILKGGLFGMQREDKFFQPSKLRKVAFILASPKLRPHKAEEFVNNLCRRLDLYGVRIDKQEFMTWEQPERDYDRLMDLAKEEFDFAFIIGDSDQLHHGMKHIELHTRLVTQHILPKTVDKANNSLFDNLAFKFNLKSGGLNWNIATDEASLKLLNNRDLLKSLMQDTMFFGIDLSHPMGSADPDSKVEHVQPSCVGFSSNLYGGQSNMSKGDFGYQKARQTIIDPVLLDQKFAAAIHYFYRNTGRYPKWIITYRAGLSEGEIEKIQRQEVPVLKSTLEKLARERPEFAACIPKLTVIMAQRKSALRVYKEIIERRDKATMQNVPTGTCVFERIVTRRVPSFLLVNQRALIGTARPSVYHVIDGADVVPLNHIRWVTYCLCFSHGIVTSPTALPSPLVSAADLSKRAQNNYKQHKYNGSDDAQSIGSGDGARHRQAQGDVMTEEEKAAIKRQEDAYFGQLNEALKSAIQEGRFWA